MTETVPINPHAGGVKIPKSIQERIRQRILDHADKKYAGRFRHIDVRFRGTFCYIDAYTEPDLGPGWPPEDWHETREQMLERLRDTPTHLCRLRYFGDEEAWSLAFYTYSNEKYSPCFFKSNSFFGTPEEGLDVGSAYLD